jgi:hypothetical protein
MPNQKPSVGRSVHYQDSMSDVERAAIITAVCDPESAGEGTVCLVIFHPTGTDIDLNVHFSETPKRGHWNWPPKV